MSKVSQNAKKLGYLTAIIIVVSSTIGAGIFFKNGELFRLAKGSLALVLISWTVAGFGMAALGLSLVELVSVQESNRGVFEWTKKFVGKKFHHMAVNYNKWIFMPAIMLTMPIYFTMTIDDALSVSGNMFSHGGIVLAIAFAIFLWFMAWNLLPVKYSAGFQWFSMSMKFLPLIIVPIFGFINMGELSFKAINDVRQGLSTGGINGVSQFMILLAGFPAITFAYDGIHNAASIKNEMKNPNKVGSATLVGVLVITVVYLFVTLGFGLGSISGTIFGIEKLYSSTWVWIAMNIFIGIGILGIVNGFLTGFIYQFADQMEYDNEANEIRHIRKIFFKKSKSGRDDKRERVLSAWTFILILTTLVFIAAGLVGIFAYNINDYQGEYGHASAETLYSFTDVLVNYTSLMFYLIIVTSILGGILNRRSKRIKTEQKKYFLYSAWISVIMFYIFGAWMVIAGFIDMFGVNGADSLSSAIKFGILAISLLISVLPVLFNKKINTPEVSKT